MLIPSKRPARSIITDAVLLVVGISAAFADAWWPYVSGRLGLSLSIYLYIRLPLLFAIVLSTLWLLTRIFTRYSSIVIAVLRGAMTAVIIAMTFLTGRPAVDGFCDALSPQDIDALQSWKTIAIAKALRNELKVRRINDAASAIEAQEYSPVLKDVFGYSPDQVFIVAHGSQTTRISIHVQWGRCCLLLQESDTAKQPLDVNRNPDSRDIRPGFTAWVR